MAIINTLYNTNPYQSKIMGGVQGDSNPFAYQNEINDFVINNEPYQEISGFNFKDAPTSLGSRLQNPEFSNNPFTGIYQGSLMQRGNPGKSVVDKAKSGIGKGFDYGKAAISGILSLITGVPFLGNILTGIGNQFENRQISGDGTIVDEFGRSYTADELNKQNAKGGYYTDAARSSRRRTSRIAKMLERQKLGKKISIKNLAKLQAQEAAQEAARERATKSIAAANKAAGDRGGYQAGYGRDSDFMGGSGTAAEMGSSAMGGIIGHGGMGGKPAQSGLASMFTRRG